MSPLIADPAVVLVKVLERTAYVAAAPRDGVTAACAAGTKGTIIETTRNKARMSLVNFHRRIPSRVVILRANGRVNMFGWRKKMYRNPYS
ncbi:MAG: hypothetical protein Q7S29_00480 [Candidatus Peribacter sp.]|nr:hypothetical protein [Candidatus Peribacter sp.]